MKLALAISFLVILYICDAVPLTPTATSLFDVDTQHGHGNGIIDQKRKPRTLFGLNSGCDCGCNNHGWGGTGWGGWGGNNGWGGGGWGNNGWGWGGGHGHGHHH